MTALARARRNPVSARFVKFVVVSGVAAAANVGSRIVLGWWLSYVPSILIAFCFGMLTAFVLNRLLVFTQTENPLHHQVLWFVAVNLLAVVQTLAVSLLLARGLFPWVGFTWHAETVAHAIGVGVPAITSYLGHRQFTFR